MVHYSHKRVQPRFQMIRNGQAGREYETMICDRIQRSAMICDSIQRSAMICDRIQRSTMICDSLQRSAMISDSNKEVQ